MVTSTPDVAHEPLASVVLMPFALKLGRTVESAMVDGMITALALLGLISLIAGACRWFTTDADRQSRERKAAKALRGVRRGSDASAE